MTRRESNMCEYQVHVNSFTLSDTHTHTKITLGPSAITLCKKTLEKKKVSQLAVSPFPTMLSILSKVLPIILDMLIFSSANAFHPLSNDKILDWSKIKHLQMTKKMWMKKLKIGLGKVEIIVENRENAGFKHFLRFPPCFQKASFSRSLKV